MASEAANSATPILDLVKPLPSRDIAVTRLLLGFLFMLPFAAALNHVLSIWGTSGLFWLFGLLIAVITIHEVGHVLAGQLLGFHIQGMAVGPVSIDNEFGVWKIKLRRLHAAYGLTALSIDRIRRVRRRFVWVT